MNWGAILCLSLSALVLSMGSALLGPIEVLFDVRSGVFVFAGTVGVLMLSYGGPVLLSHGWGGLRSWLSMVKPARWTQDDHGKAFRVAQTGGLAAFLMAAVGGLIGCMNMLQALDNPSALGPPLAVMMLCPLYGVTINALIFVPLSRHHAAAMGAGEGSGWVHPDPAPLLWNGLAVLCITGLGAGLAIVFMMLAFATWN